MVGGARREATALARAERPTGATAALARLEAFAAARSAALLTALIVLYTAAYTGLNWYRMGALRQGFDFLVYEQPIWNTVHGRPFAQSMYAFTPTHLGVDLVFFEALIAPFYALWGSPLTLFLLISLGAALGALPLFLIARERFDSALAGLGWAALSLAFLPVGAITLSEFQPRLFAASALLGAWWFARRDRPVAFWLCLVLALSVRSDVGLVVGGLGLYHLAARWPPRYGLAPALVGFGYWILAVFVIVPRLAGGHGFLFQVNYTWLGDSSRAIVGTILQHPFYVARGVLTIEKGRYLAQLLWPFAFLPLLRPGILAVAAPIVALNLLSGEIVQYDLFHQYQALIVPFLLLAAIEGLADLRAADEAGRRRRLLALLGTAIGAAVLLLPLWPGNADSRNGLRGPVAAVILLAFLIAPLALGFLARRRAPALIPAALAALLALMLLQHAALGSEPLRFLKHPGPSPRLPAAERLIARIPPDAPLAVTSQLAIHVPLRRALYHFPGNSSYDPALVARARYVLADRQRDGGREAGDIERLIATGAWRIVAEERDFVLLERR